LVLEQDSLDELTDPGLLVEVELGGGFEREPQAFVGAAFVGRRRRERRC
jgi:hypothetical protein